MASSTTAKSMKSQNRPAAKKKRSKGSVSPLAKCWTYGRYCCFRFGMYPLAVAPILTAAFLLSVYSTTGCRFVEVDLGFSPTPNESWNSSSASLGFYYHYRPDQPYAEGESKFDPELADTVHENCYWYSDAMEDNFIESDRTWKVARIMALISAGGSGLSAILAWSFVGPCYCPVNVLWPAFLLPIVMMSFIAEGSKFLIFDMSICRNKIFKIETEDGSEEFQGADSCSLGESAILAIVSGCLLLVGMLMVCLNIPNERELDPNFGMSNGSTDDSSDGIEDYPEQRMGSAMKSRHRDSQRRSDSQITDIENPEVNVVHQEGNIDFTDEYFEDDDDSERYSKSLTSSQYMKTREPPSPLSMPPMPRPKHPYDEDVLGNVEEEDEDFHTTAGNSTLASSKVGVEPVRDEIRISESRLSTLASVENSVAGSANSPTASNMLESLVQDLNSSYHQESSVADSGRTSPTSSRRSQYS
mmetsp:Transcript_35024/g.72932  ORF Transcript_35024/g.72932 Transcript_35024/m.72932 type:complete len:472 (-) Transcript_35024:1193-2608(-)|eukprot:CAMPEP_0172451312 /NCGR_PEP_ID=MMETSP1065-20121228/9406_1 /TAXON_ID=265537 /ORGANISM="Amphiprora paludosa, Strain CCMP125" /LENGTH=471 /DNA_ID=CAMNT_0013203261 /DNA_START=274 /DNA_END=1689 /DNA_ORIENTATION=-